MAFEQTQNSEKFQTTETTTEQQRESMQNLSADLLSKSQDIFKNNSTDSASGSSASSLPKISIEGNTLNFEKCSGGGNVEVIKLDDLRKPFAKKKEIAWDDNQDLGLGPKLSFGK